MQKQLEKASTGSTESKKVAAAQSSDNNKDYRNVPPPHKFSDAAYDEQKKQIAEDIDEAVQIAAELIQNEKLKKKKKSSTAVSTNDPECDDVDDEKTASKKRRHSDETLEEGEVKAKKTKPAKGADAAFFLGIDLGDISSDDEDEELKSNQNKKKKALN